MKIYVGRLRTEFDFTVLPDHAFKDSGKGFFILR